MNEIVKDYLMRCFLQFADARDAETLADRLVPDMVKDLKETADKKINDCDIDIALVRALKNYLDIEE